MCIYIYMYTCIYTYMHTHVCQRGQSGHVWAQPVPICHHGPPYGPMPMLHRVGPRMVPPFM